MQNLESIHANKEADEQTILSLVMSIEKVCIRDIYFYA